MTREEFEIKLIGDLVKGIDDMCLKAKERLVIK